MKKPKILIVSAAALGFRFWEKNRKADFWNRLSARPVKTVFPALTCPVQASFRTASEPASHGMFASGVFNREIRKTFFWEQSSGLYEGARIWDKFRENGGRVGQICWQNSLGNESDLLLSPAPVHKHHGGMIQAFYSRPERLYGDICSKIGSKFNLFNYWGPFTSIKSSRWITDTTCEILKSASAPDLLLAYIPHLDYDLQKFGPESDKAARAFKETEFMLEKLFATAKLANFEIGIFGDYAITPAQKAIFPNRILLDKGYFSVRSVKGMLYPDLWSSKAFAMVDHQIAHVYIQNKNDIENVRKILSGIDGIKTIHNHSEMNHKNAGDLILEAEAGHWFAYHWWNNKSEMPDYATHVDIHSKPGFDPCELFMSIWPPMSISSDTTKIKGTHGSANSPEHEVFWGATFDSGDPGTITGAAKALKQIL